MTKTKTAKRPTTRLSKPIKANFTHWLYPDYYGRKTEYEKYDRTTDAYNWVTEPLPVNNKDSLNFWLNKSGLSGKDKRQTVCDLVRLYAKDEVPYSDVRFFCNPISQRKITQHFRGEDTYYYVNKPRAKVVNLMFDWDDKDRLYGDTHEAAKWLDRTHLLGQGYIEASTSLTGAHQFVFVHVDGVDIIEQKKLYARLIPLLQLEAKEAGFKCWADLDQVKGVGPVISWHQSTAKQWASKPSYYQIDTCGIFAKLPRLKTPEDEANWLNRRIVTWDHLVGLVEKLTAKHHPEEPRREEEQEKRRVVGCVTGPVSFDDLEAHVSPKSQKVIAAGKLTDMLGSGDKQRVALACVFSYELAHGRRPTEADFDALNAIYNQSNTATGTTLTADRCKMFAKALKYSEGRQSTRKPLIAPEALQTAYAAFQSYDLTQINQKLVKAKQRKVGAFEVARVWAYFNHCLKTRAGTEEAGRVPWEGIKGLADADHQFDAKKHTKLSRNAITAVLSSFKGWGLIEVVSDHRYSTHDCAQYRVTRNP